MRAVARLVQQVAGTSLTVLIQGEPGVGKELVAKAIHDLSDRASSAWVTVNCSSLPAGLLESVLFGHEKGAFAGADSRKPGRLELADGGTMFLDQIDELPLRLQAKVLHFLQADQFFRAGGRDAVTVDVRVTAATSKNLETMVTSGAFREELWYRLNVVTIYVPPLRERREEIDVLAEQFREKFEKQFKRSVPKLSVETHELLAAYGWPGNIRELENLVKRYVALGEEEHLQEELKARLRITRTGVRSVAGPPSVAPTGLGLREIGRRAAREAERVAIEEVLEKVQYNRAEAARHLKISYKTLLHKLIDNGFGRKRPRRRP
jgi:DNA-binding NtrC family response regulator